jgi:hypothetical protein
VHVGPCLKCDNLQKDVVGGSSDDTACYHYNLIDDLELKRLHARTTEIVIMMNAYMKERLEASTLVLPDVSKFELGEIDFHSITYKPPTESLSSKYYDFLDKELLLRLMDPRGGVEQKRRKLRDRLKQEKELQRLLAAIATCSPDPKAIVKVNKLLPCILHLEIRVGIKIFSMIVAQGLSHPGDRKGQDDFVKKTEEFVNTEVLGTHNQPTVLKGTFL